ncbi:MAG TPA: hypothetical protein VFR49_08430 [Solirubrobacteraceae bacterium]|nr:hypothetical protein [Solirubrobacteraceae bacterium]
MGRRAIFALAAAVILGVVLRLVWPADMEYKADELFLFTHATGPHPFPWVGQSSGVGTPNPGMGIWVYSLMANGFRLQTPVALVRGVMVLNAVALVALAAFALRVIPARQREPWIWGTALVAVNPLAILFSRKLWIQSALPPFVVATFLAWWRRGQRGGAFAWGLLGAWLGQIHMSGFFAAGGLAAWTAWRDRHSVRWRWWLAGSALGAATLVPWLVSVLGHQGTPMRSLVNSLEPRIWGLWITYPLSADLFDSFGTDSTNFLAWPTAGGTSLYLVGLTSGVILAVGAAICAEALALTVWPRRRRPARPLGGAASNSGLLARGSFWGYGLLITASGVLIYRHYMIVTFALPFVAVAAAALLAPVRGRRLLLALVVAEAALSVSYLTYIHVRGGAPGGDYGVAYDAQRHAGRP